MSGNTDGLNELICACLAGIFGVFVGVIVVGPIVDTSWKDACVRHGAAEYNQTTGAWQWKAEGTE